MGIPASAERAVGHGQLFERVIRAGVSRRQFLRRTTAVVAGLGGLELLRAVPAFAGGSDPKPIPGGFSADFVPVPIDPLIHILPPAVGFEMSSITDFNGVVGAAEIQGTARGSDGSTFGFDTDMRFMRGAYVGTDGRFRQGAFGFI